MEHIIDWPAFGFELAALARDADAAEGVLKRRHIDVIISDIRMPGRDGLSLLASVNRRSPQTLVLFMSAYSEFAYAKQALEHGCFAYLLKPVNVGELADVLQRCKRRLDDRKREQAAVHNFRDYNLFSALIDLERDASDNLEALAARGFRPERGGTHYILLAKPRSPDVTDRQSEALSETLQREGVTQISYHLGSGRRVYLASVPRQSIASAVKLYRRVLRTMEEERLDAGLSAPIHRWDRIGMYYYQASMMSDTPKLAMGGAVQKHGLFKYSRKVNADVPALLERIAAASRIEHLEGVFYDLQRSVQRRRVHLNGLAECFNVFVSRLAAMTDQGDRYSQEALEAQDLIIHYGHAGQVLEELKALLRTCKQPEEKSDRRFIREIAQEIDRAYANKISLNDMARRYFISPNYLSQLFKQEMGQSFINYLVQKRLRAAENLLSENLPLIEVAKAVGYEDYAHFSKLFKKHYGRSPLEYRNELERP